MYRPPFALSAAVLRSLQELWRQLGRFEGVTRPQPQPELRRRNRIRTIQASVAIEGNSLSEAQVTAVLSGKRVAGSVRELREVENANEAYSLATTFRPDRERDLLRAHSVLMSGLIPDAGRFRRGQVGVLKGSKVAHLAPPPHLIRSQVQRLLRFVGRDQETPRVIRACAAHYELEFIHPFSDGNGRMGRLWQHAILLGASPVFEHVPVESVIKARQREYYRALAKSDRAGDCTPFIEFSLRALVDAVEELWSELRPTVSTADDRLARAREELGKSWFTRRAYRTIHKAISTASASRDLLLAVERGELDRKGDKATARYRFRARAKRSSRSG